MDIEFDWEKANQENANIWNDDIELLKDMKEVSPSKIRELGLTIDNLREVSTLEDLAKNPPNIIIAEAMRQFTFIQNFFKTQTVKKKQKYVMGMGVYRQLQYEKNTNKKLLRPTKPLFKNIFKPYRGQDLNGKSILVFRTGGIGDLLFIQPNLRYIKKEYPDCHIMFACGPQYRAMVENWDCIDELLELPFTLKKLLEADYHVLFEGVIERCKEAHTQNAYNLFSRWMGLDLPDELLIPKQEPKDECLEKAREVIEEWGLTDKPFIVMQLRASSPIRTPRHEFWVELMDRITDAGYDIVLTDNPRQQDPIEEFRKKVKNPDMVYNFCKHSISLDYSIALVKLAKLVVATDSALNHIAASLGTACYGIYGPFPGFIRLKTYPLADWIDSIKQCAPCFLHGHRECPYAKKDRYSPCYDELDKNVIIEKVKGMMER